MGSRRKIAWILVAFGLFTLFLCSYKGLRGWGWSIFDMVLFGILPLGVGWFLTTRVPNKISPSVEKTILKLAAGQENLLTVVDVALNTSLSMEQAAEALEVLRRKGHVTLKVADNGALVYEFQAVLTMDDKLSAERV